MNRFAIVPNEALSDPELTPAEFKVLVALYSFRDKNADTVFPKLDQLAARAGYKETTQVSKITTRLEKRGWLTKASKKSFHGPKKYRLTIPLRLLMPEPGPLEDDQFTQVGETAQVGRSELDEYAQVGRNAQVGRYQQDGAVKSDETAQLGGSAQVGQNGNTNLGIVPKPQLGRYTQDDPEHTSEHTNEHSVTANAATAAGAALPVDNSLEELSLAALLDLVRSPEGPKRLFDVGVKYLGARGIAEKRARSLIAKLIAEYREGPVFDAFEAMLVALPNDPIQYLLAVLKGRMHEIPADWTPPEAMVAKYTGAGVPPDVIRKARDAFVEHYRLSEVRHHDWEDLFERRMGRHYEKSEGNPGVLRRVVAQSAGFEPKPFVEPTSL